MRNYFGTPCATCGMSTESLIKYRNVSELSTGKNRLHVQDKNLFVGTFFFFFFLTLVHYLNSDVLVKLWIAKVQILRVHVRNE